MAENEQQKVRGRPPKDGISKEVRIELRVIEDDRDLWNIAAKSVGKDRSEWMRDTLNKTAKRLLKK